MTCNDCGNQKWLVTLVEGQANGKFECSKCGAKVTKPTRPNKKNMERRISGKQ
jgi:ribosomal protein S27E